MITINEVFSYLGNISSIAGIILTVYTILRSIEKSHEITKKEIVRTLLIQLRDFNKISNLEIKSIIKSKCRENNLSIRNISPKQVIDDLFFEVISSPLLNKEKKRLLFRNAQSFIF
jgi:Rps23 Pro-64 3,4-dihydroxylase Tpa1-like proline 4-hydroxylase